PIVIVLEERAPILGLCEAFYPQHVGHVGVVEPHVTSGWNKPLDPTQMLRWVASLRDSQDNRRLLTPSDSAAHDGLPDPQEPPENPCCLPEDGKVAVVEERGLRQKLGIELFQAQGDADEDKVLYDVAASAHYFAVGRIWSKGFPDPECVGWPQ